MPTPDLTIISACYGNWDTVIPAVPQEDLTVEWVLVTDDPDIEALGWTVIVEKRPHVHPCIAAKVPKFRPDLYCQSFDSLWIDASASRIGSGLALMAKKALEWPSDVAVFPHPMRRNRLTREVLESRLDPKYDGQDLEGQVASYIDHGMPDDYGLWATGGLAMSYSGYTRELGTEWMEECVRWSMQDQLSFPYLMWTRGCRPNVLHPHQNHCPQITYGGHN